MATASYKYDEKEIRELNDILRSFFGELNKVQYTGRSNVNLFFSKLLGNGLFHRLIKLKNSNEKALREIAFLSNPKYIKFFQYLSEKISTFDYMLRNKEIPPQMFKDLIEKIIEIAADNNTSFENNWEQLGNEKDLEGFVNSKEWVKIQNTKGGMIKIKKSKKVNKSKKLKKIKKSKKSKKSKKYR